MNIKKTFYSKEERQDVLKNVSFSLPDKGMYFIVGKSGSGKSTLLNLMGGLDTPDSESIEFNGLQLEKLSSKELGSYRARSIGFVFQESNLFDDKENIVVLEKDFFESLSKNTYFESDFNSFDLYSESLDFKSKFNIGGYTTDDYGKGKGYIYVSDSLYSKIIEKAKPYITPYSEIIYPFTGNLGKDLSALNDIKTNVTDVSIKFDSFDFTKWKGSSVTSNRFYYESRKKSSWLMDIIKIVEYVSWGFIALCSLFLLLSIIDLIQKSIKKIGVLSMSLT